MLQTLKNTWFALLCCIWGIVHLGNASLSPLFLSACALCLISLFLSIFQRKIEEGITQKYSENYAQQKIGLWKYLFGSLSIMLFYLA